METQPIEAHKLAVKFFAEQVPPLAPDAFIPVFHSWIQTHAVTDHLLVDVADYAHVHNGPGIILVAHEANYYMDKGEGRLGLLYVRKQPTPGTFADRLRQAFTSALEACARLEQDARLSGLRFGTGEAIFRINDRLLAPNTPATFDAVRPELQRFVDDLYEAEVTLEHKVSPASLFEVRIKSSAAPSIATVLSRLAKAPAPAR